MTRLEIIKRLSQLNLEINNLISLLSEQTVINNNETIADNTPEKIDILGSELQEEETFFSESNIEILEGESFEESVTPGQEIIIDDGEELTLE